MSTEKIAFMFASTTAREGKPSYPTLIFQCVELPILATIHITCAFLGFKDGTEYVVKFSVFSKDGTQVLPIENGENEASIFTTASNETGNEDVPGTLQTTFNGAKFSVEGTHKIICKVSYASSPDDVLHKAESYFRVSLKGRKDAK